VQDIDRIEFAPVTVLAGDNGTGKSTIVEAVAIAAGFNAEGGSRNLRFATHPTHSALHEHLTLFWHARPRWGWFLRTETFAAMAAHVASDPDLAIAFPDLDARSHGESHLDLVHSRFARPGLYILDEPEAALSIQGQMVLARVIHDAVAAGAQFVIATHSPFLMAYPEARLHEVSADGIDTVDYADLVAVALWERALADPAGVYRRLFADE
jgi:predicted ATPase